MAVLERLKNLVFGHIKMVQNFVEK